MKFSYKKAAATVIIFTMILTSILILVAYRNDAGNNSYILKEYNDTVALYKNKKIVAVYDGVVVSALPYSDRLRLSEGITVESPDAAQSIMEDYDG